MALDGWTGTPTLVNGQVMSAESHLNWMAHNTRLLYGALMGPRTPFVGLGGSTDSGVYVTVATYRLRHHTNSLSWHFSLDCAQNGTMTGKLVIGGLDVPGTEQSAIGGAYQEFTGTTDISGLGLTVGTFYDIELKCYVDSFGGVGRVWRLAEYAVTSPTLIAFADDVTPTAVQWQALSTAGQSIMAVLDAPNAPLLSYGQNVRAGLETDWVWWGSCNRACRYLVVSAGITCNEDAEATLTFYVNGNARLTLRLIGARWPPHNGGQFVTVFPNAEVAYVPVVTGEPNYTPANGSQTFIVVADTTGWGLTLNNLYTIQAKLTWTDTGEEGQPDIGAAVHYIFETPEGSPTLAGYTDPPTWAYADYVFGDSTAKQVDTLRVDTETLATYAVMWNRPAPYWAADRSDSWPWQVRKHRWLHYVNAAGDAPDIRWHDGSQWQETSMPDSGGNKFIADLASFAGLFPGVRYQLNRVTWALEDSDI